MCIRKFLSVLIIVGLGFWSSSALAQKIAQEQGALILPSERKLSFETDEGTWMSLDVSPKSGEIVFELLGDLYVLPSEGGVAKPISTGTAFDSQPIFSPDGNTIAFISDRSGNENIWMAKPDGTDLKQITNVATGVRLLSPSWSPDGRYIYVSKAERVISQRSIWAYHVAGGNGFPLNGNTQNENLHDIGAHATADGHFIYFTRRNGPLFADNMLSHWNVFRQNLHTGKQEQLLSAPGSSMNPVVSPDGKYLAYITRKGKKSELRLRNLQTMEDRSLAYPLTRDLQDSFVIDRGLFPSYSFAKDGRDIIIPIEGKIKRVSVTNGAIRDIPFKASVNLDLAHALKTSLTDEVGPVQARVIQAPRLSPNGKRLTFSALGKIYVMSLPNGKPVRLTETPLKNDGIAEHFPSWSPDGRWITYTSWQNKKGISEGHIWKVRSWGGSPIQLTEAPAFYRKSAFTPDGKFVVALRGSAYDRSQTYMEVRAYLPNQQDLVRVGARGGDIMVLGSVSNATTQFYDFYTADMGRVHFDNDGENVYVYTADGLLKAPLSGGDVNKLIEVGFLKEFSIGKEQASVDNLLLSPDGNWLLARADTQLYLVGMPPFGGDDVEIDLTNPSTPVQRLTDIGADFFSWEDGGETISWTIGSTYYRLALADVKFGPDTSGDTSEKTGEAQPFLEAAATRLDIAVELPRDTPSTSIVLRGATAITMKGDEIIENADVLITDNRITAIGVRGDVPIPGDAKIQDLSGKFITPGFTDTHAHWMGVRRGLVDLDSWLFPTNLAYGVTSGLDVQAFTNDLLVYQDLIDVGVISGPRAYNVGRGVFALNQFSSRRQALGVLKRYKEHYRTGNIKSYGVGNRLQRQYVASAAAELDLMATTEGMSDTKMDLTHALDGFSGNEHGMPVTTLYKDVVELYARSGIGYTPALVVSYGGPSGSEHFYAHENPLDDKKLNHFTPRQFLTDRSLRRSKGVHENQHIYSEIAESAVRIFRAGGKIGIGSHGELQGLGYHWEMQLMASGGATSHEVLQMATLSSATVIGRQTELGSLEKGKFADLIVFNENPLDDIRNTLAIEYVMKNGRLYDGDDLAEVPSKK